MPNAKRFNAFHHKLTRRTRDGWENKPFSIALNVHISKTIVDTAKSYYLYEVAYALSIDNKIDEFWWHWTAMSSKHPVPDRDKPSFVIFDLRALWRSAMCARVPGCQKLQMTDPGLAQDAL